MKSNLTTIKKALENYSRGEMLIVVDDENRENEGDFIMSAQHITPEAINFMATYGRGLICVPLSQKRISELKLPMMTQRNPHHGTAFTVSVDAKNGITTGISTYDRALTIQTLINPKTKASDLVTPGHIFPLCSSDTGVLGRRGHTEAAVDLSKLTGIYPAGVICEILNPDGTMARLPELKKLSAKFSIEIISVEQIVAHRSLYAKNA